MSEERSSGRGRSEGGDARSERPPTDERGARTDAAAESSLAVTGDGPATSGAGGGRERAPYRPDPRANWIALIGVLLCWPLVSWGAAALRADRTLDRSLRIVLAGPNSIAPGHAARLRVELWDAAGEPVDDAAFRWTAFDAGGVELEKGRVETGADGVHEWTLTAGLAGPARVEVRAWRGEARASAELEFQSAEEAPLAHLRSDKPAYRPGETAWLRGLLLERGTFEPYRGQCHLRLVDPRGALVEEWRLALEDGVVATSWQIPADTSGGEYALELRNATDDFPFERLPLLVRAFRPPTLKTKVELGRETYAPGESGRAHVASERVAGGTPSGAPVRASLVIDGQEVWSETGVLAADGTADFEFVVPKEVERGDARLALRITDGGVVETRVEPFVVPTGRVLVDFYPEGGELVAGVTTRVYAAVRDPLERPLSATGRVVDEEGREVAHFETWHQGRARFELRAETDARYFLELDGPSGAKAALGASSMRIELPRAIEGGVALRALVDECAPGTDLPLELVTPSPGPWTVAAFCRGRLVGQDSFTGSGSRRVDLSLGDAAGVLRVTVFDASLAPVAERLVRALPSRALRIELEPEHATRLPGQHQSIGVRTLDESGAPVAAVVGLAVTDAAVRELVGDARIGLADQSWLAADVEELEDAREFLHSAAMPAGEVARNVDLLLGTEGWRRFAWTDLESLVEREGERGERLLARLGWVDRPNIDDRSNEAASEWFSQSFRVDRARRIVPGLYLVELLVAAVALFVVGIARKLRRRAGRGDERAPVWAWALGLAFGVGAFALLQHGGRLTGGFAPNDAAAGELRMVAAFEDAAAVARPAHVQELAPIAFEPRPEVMRGVFALGAVGGPGAPPPGAGGGGGPEGARFAAAGLAPGQAKEEAPDRDEVELEEALVERLDGLGYAGADVVRQARVPVRVYAHEHRAGGGGLRTDFTETVYWNALLRTDEEGRARVAFDLSDRVTEWRVEADAHGAGRVGQASVGFEALPPLEIDVDLPSEVSAGDRLELPLAIACSDASVTSARVTLALAGPLVALGETSFDVALANGRGGTLVPIDVAAEPGTARIALGVTAAGFRDAVVREFEVVPTGFPIHLARSGRLDGVRQLDVNLPNEWVPGSLRARLVLYPSPLADTLQGLDSILREPHGCFEQASSANYPNILCLAYLEAAGVEAPEAAARARELLARGYEKIAGYECSERGYEWFGSNPGHEALTAYGLLEFHDMAAVHAVDDGMVGRTRTWLLSRRDGQGGYERNPQALDSFGRAPQAVTDSYCTYALVASGTPVEELATELERLERRALESDDAYEVAIATCGLAEAGRADAADAARERLKAMQREDGSLVGAATSITSSGGVDFAVETTAFAILAWLTDADDLVYAERGLAFLVDSRRGGGFGATQATIMALKALVAHAEVARRVPTAGSVLVRVDGRDAEEVAFEAGRVGAIELDGLEAHLSPGPNRIELVLEGGGEFPFSFEVDYHSEFPADGADPPLRLRTRWGSEAAASGSDGAGAPARVERGRTVALEVRVENARAEGLPMSLVVIGLPAGLEAPTAVLDDLRDAGRFDVWELRGRELVLYWRDFAPRAAREVVIDLVARTPGRSVGPASRAYPYYEPAAVRWARPLAVEVVEAR